MRSIKFTAYFFLALISSAHAAQYAQPGQVPGTATSDNASAGNAGEYITATGTAVSLTTATPANITSVSLTAGDWSCAAEVTFNPAGTTTQTAIAAGMNTTTSALPIAPNGGLTSIGAALTTGVGSSLTTSAERYSLSATTTLYLVAQAAFAVSTDTATGKLSCNRRR